MYSNVKKKTAYVFDCEEEGGETSCKILEKFIIIYLQCTALSWN